MTEIYILCQTGQVLNVAVNIDNSEGIILVRKTHYFHFYDPSPSPPPPPKKKK